MSSSPKAIKQPPVLTMAEAEALLSRLSEVIPALMAVIEQETALVRAGHLIAAMRLEPRKAQLAGLYLSDAARVKASSLSLNQQLPARCRELRRKHDELHAQLRINLTVLATAHAVSEGIIRGVARELARKASPKTYGVSGRTSVPRVSAVQPVAISRVL
jgi:uncharacterized protein (DUF885 family)